MTGDFLLQYDVSGQLTLLPDVICFRELSHFVQYCSSRQHANIKTPPK